MADTTGEVYKSICEITRELSRIGISKNKKNAQQGYAFRGIDDVYAALSGLLAEHQLCILPRVVERENVERQTKSGSALFYTTLKVEFDFVSAKDGSTHTVAMIGEAMDSADKSSNKAQSAAYKYACLQTFCIPTEGDNDADASHHDVKPKGRSYFENGAARKRFFDDLIKQLREATTLEYAQGVWQDNRQKILEIRNQGNDEDKLGVDTAVSEYDKAKKRIEQQQAALEGHGQGFANTPAGDPLVDDLIKY